MCSVAGGKAPHPTRRRHGCGDYTLLPIPHPSQRYIQCFLYREHIQPPSSNPHSSPCTIREHSFGKSCLQIQFSWSSSLLAGLWPAGQGRDAPLRGWWSGHAFTVNICYVYGNEANLHLLWGVSRAAPLSPWRRLPATDNVILNAFWRLHVSLECGEMKLLIHCKCFCLCFTEVLVFKTPSPLETITWRGGTIASWVKHEWRIVQNLSDTLHTSFELPLAAASVHSPSVSSLQSALYSTVC